MPRIWIDYMDGRYTTRVLAEDEVVARNAHGDDAPYVEDRVYEAYLRHCDQDDAWQMLWRTLDNEVYARRRAERHPQERGEYTCVYPQPGCQLEVLQRVSGATSEWIKTARQIVTQPRFAERAAEGMKYQGCCCGYGTHLLLDDGTVQMLRDAGFVVENDCEPADTEHA